MSEVEFPEEKMGSCRAREKVITKDHITKRGGYIKHAVYVQYREVRTATVLNVRKIGVQGMEECTSMAASPQG